MEHLGNTVKFRQPLQSVAFTKINSVIFVYSIFMLELLWMITIYIISKNQISFSLRFILSNFYCSAKFAVKIKVFLCCMYICNLKCFLFSFCVHFPVWRQSHKINLVLKKAELVLDSLVVRHLYFVLFKTNFLLQDCFQTSIL